jgi:hypothetical protein
MAKIKVESQASGTGVYTLKSGTSNTDYTITLPDEDITLGGGVDGIVSTADATAITIDSSERVGFGTTTPQAIIVSKESTVSEAINFVAESHGSAGETGGYYFAAHGVATPRRKQAIVNKKNTGGSTGDYGVGSLHFLVDTNTDDADVAIGDSKLEITSDGRGVSQFTARAWCNIDFVGTVSIRDSHNISSITDNGTGNVQFNFTNSMSNSQFVYFGLIPRQWGSEAMVAENTDYNGREQSTSRAIIGTRGSNTGNYLDSPRVMIGVFGD